MSEASEAEHSVDKTYDPNEEELQGYTFMKTLGKGNFGKVRLGVHVLTGQYVAIKILEKDLIFEKADIERISREIKIMKLIRHKNIVQLYEIIEKPKRLYLIMQYADGGDLFDLIVKSEKLSQKSAINYYAQILLGLEYLHGKGVAHRDMKPENILISGGKIKIADFGLGNFFNQGEMLKTACGSPCYASPEMLQRVPYNPEKADIWSSGIILYAMVHGYLPFEDEVTTRLYEKIKNNNPKLNKMLSEGVKSILKRVLDKNPQTRPNIAQLKEDSIIKPQFQAQKVQQFEVDSQKLAKICQIYGISDPEKLASYLRKNKHNNLTTIYYLANKNKTDDLSPERRHQGKQQVKEVQGIVHDIISQTSINEAIQENNKAKRDQEAKEKDRKSRKSSDKLSNPELYPQNLFTHTESIIEGPGTENQVESGLKQDIQPIMEVSQIVRTQEKEEKNGEIEDRKEVKAPEVSEPQVQEKKDSIKNDVSFSQLDSFSSQKQIPIDAPPAEKQVHSQQKQSIEIQNSLKKQPKQLQIPIANQIQRHQLEKQPQIPAQMVIDNGKTKKESLKQSRKQEKQPESPMIVINQSSFAKEKLARSGTKAQEKKIQKKTSLNQSVTFQKQKPSRIIKQNVPQIIKNSKEIPAPIINKTNDIKKQEKQLKSSEEMKNYSSVRSIHKEEERKLETRNSFHREKDKEGIENHFEKKPKMVKTGRMQTVRANQPETNRKAPALYERSHSRDKTITTKKIIGKQISAEPFLLDVSKLVLCPWPIFSSILTEKGAEGRIQYFTYGKTCLYISKSSLKGIRSLKQIIQKINCGEIQ